MSGGELTGRRILIAGGAAGIGAATVALFREEGAKVAILDRAPPSGRSADAPALTADVREAAAVDRAVGQAAAAFGALDGLVFCVGIDFLSPLVETADEDWLRVMDVNLNGAMRVTRAALRVFAPERGTIVLVSSAAGLKPLASRTAYCASKAALIMLAKALAEALAPRDIRVNALCPGAVDTDLLRWSLEGAADAAAALQAVRDRYALKRIAEPHEMARVLLFLTGAASSYVTGVALAADGGRVFH